MIARWAHHTFAALSNRHYRVLMGGTALAFLSMMMSPVLQSVLAFELTGRNSAVGLVTLGNGIAFVTLAPFGGVVADRVSKRKLILGGQTAMGTLFIMIGILVEMDLVTIYWLMLSTFVTGCIFAFMNPARQAWVGELLPRELMPNGVALTQVAQAAARIVGPFVAGMLIAIPFIGMGGAYLVMGGFYVLVLFTLSHLPASAPRQDGATRRSVLGDLKGGLRHAWERPRLRVQIATFVLVTFTGFSYYVLLPGFMENELGMESKKVWILLISGAIPGLVMTMGLAGLAGTQWARPLMLAGATVLGSALVLLAIAPSLPAACAAMALVGAGTGMFHMLNNALVMREAEQAYFGRVMSLIMVSFGISSFAGWPAGAIADALGEGETFLIMGLCVLSITAVAMVVNASVSQQVAPAVAADPATEPAGGAAGS